MLCVLNMHDNVETNLLLAFLSNFWVIVSIQVYTY